LLDGPATASSTTKGQKRKSLSATASSAEQPVAKAKKAKTIPSAANSSTSNQPQRPTPRQVSKVQAAQLVGPASPAVPGVAREDQAGFGPRKRPQVVEVDEVPVPGPPSKKIKTNALRRTGLFHTSSESTVAKYILETSIELDNGSQAVILRRTDGVDMMALDDATVATPRQKGAVEYTDIQSSKSARREGEESKVDVQVEPIVEKKRNKGRPVPDSESAVVRTVRDR
jgi:hypothetical protein